TGPPCIGHRPDRPAPPVSVLILLATPGPNPFHDATLPSRAHPVEKAAGVEPTQENDVHSVGYVARGLATREPGRAAALASAVRSIQDSRPSGLA
ncbi:MAG: hypothetical protein AAF219_11045, partial [Myxococcota bacterium]